MIFHVDFKTFVVYVAILEALLAEMIINPLRKAQIAVLKQDEAFTKVLIKYSDFADFFLKKKALVLSEKTKFN